METTRSMLTSTRIPYMTIPLNIMGTTTTTAPDIMTITAITTEVIIHHIITMIFIIVTLPTEDISGVIILRL